MCMLNPSTTKNKFPKEAWLNGVRYLFSKSKADISSHLQDSENGLSQSLPTSKAKQYSDLGPGSKHTDDTKVTAKETMNHF